MDFNHSRKVAEILQAFDGQPAMAVYLIGEVFGDAVTAEVHDINGRQIVVVREVMESVAPALVEQGRAQGMIA